MNLTKEKHATFTPGPWKLSSIDGVEDSLMVGGGGDGSDIVADIRDEKDARLIAAAPEMYETMKAILAVVNDPGPIFPGTAIGDKLREVLAKVEGGVNDTFPWEK